MRKDVYEAMADHQDRHWWFRGRGAIVRQILQTLNLTTNVRILEIGCGMGGNLNMLARIGSVHAVEPDPDAVAYAARLAPDAQVRQGGLPDALPFPGKFALVVMLDVLEHIEDDSGALVSVREILTDTGLLLLTVPACQALFGSHDRALHHHRRYSRKELTARLASAGFHVRYISHFNMLLFPAFLLARFIDKLRKPENSLGYGIPVAPLNGLLAGVFSAERHMVPRFRLPFGSSLVAICEPARCRPQENRENEQT